MPNEPTVSVIVPVYNGASTLPAALRALQGQTRPPDEVIVVDDGSTDGSADVARRFGLAQPPPSRSAQGVETGGAGEVPCPERAEGGRDGVLNLRVISQSNAGPAAARNRGAAAARGDILLFTDADCAPARDWVERMASPFNEPEVAGAKGVYRTRQRELVARFVQAEYEDRYDRMRPLGTIDFVDTYSAAYRRDVFLACGGFDTSFPTASVEDQEFSFRLAEAGHRLVFVPHARVCHLHDRTLSEYARRKFWIGYWKVRVMREHPGKLVRDSHTPQVLKLQIALAGIGAVFIVAGFLRRGLAVVGWVTWAAFLVSALPFGVKLMRRDPAVVLIAPLCLFVRAWALGLGFLVGLLRLPVRRSESSSSP